MENGLSDPSYIWQRNISAMFLEQVKSHGEFEGVGTFFFLRYIVSDHLFVSLQLFCSVRGNAMLWLETSVILSRTYFSAACSSKFFVLIPVAVFLTQELTLPAFHILFSGM